MHFFDQVWRFFTLGSNWSGTDGIASRLWLQVELCAVVIAAATALGAGIGFVLGHVGRGGFIAVNSSNAARAIPSLTLLTLLAIEPYPGLDADGFLTAFFTLVALAIPPILTNSYVAMREVDPDLKEAARGVGMGSWQCFWRVEVPLALPLAVAGIRTAAVEVVATSTLAAYVTYNDLGEFIFAGLALNDATEAFAGSLLVAALAGVTDLVLYGLYRLVTPRALIESGSAAFQVTRGVVRRLPTPARTAVRAS